MAEDFNDIFENFGDKSLEELGSSLLSRQDAINKKRAKEEKKSRRIGQALAILGVGQKIFKNAYNKRAKELDDLKVFEIANNTEQGTRINQMSDLLTVFDESDFAADLSTDERLKNFLANDKKVDLLEQKLGGNIDTILKEISMFEGFNTRPEYLKTKEYLTEEAARYFLEGNRVKNFETELQKLYTDKNLDRMELLEKGMGLTSTDLTRAEIRYYDNLKQQYRDRGILQSIKDIGTKLGRRSEKNGEINLFRNVNERFDLYGSMDTALSDLNINPKLVLLLNESIANFTGSTSEFRMKADSNPELQLAVSNQVGGIANLRNKSIARDEILQMGPNKGKDFDLFYEAIKNDANMNENFIRDITTMVIAFREPTSGSDVAVKMYEANMNRLNKEVTQQARDEFIKNIETDETFAIKFATIMTGNIGFKEIKKAGFNIRTYDSSGLVDGLDKDYTYNIYDNPLSIIIDDGIKTPQESSSGKYEIDRNWSSMSAANQMLAFDKQVNTIVKSRISDSKKMLLLENLFEEIQNPRQLNFEDYMEYFNNRYTRPYSPYQPLTGPFVPRKNLLNN
tara:strand:- start:701 stop:2404 length:1704 start_codon:yes stop_codon:yes gene_type:complete